MVLDQDTANCINQNGFYNGNQRFEYSGNPCMPWETALREMTERQMEIPIYFNLTYFPDQSWEALGAKCRYWILFNYSFT